MSYFIAGYMIVWIGVTCYIAHLGAVHFSLQRRVDALQEHVEDQQEQPSHAASRAA